MYATCRHRQGKVEVLGNLGSRTAAIFDLEGDGDLDIVTGDFNSAPQFLVSDLSERREVHRVEVVLKGTVSNRDGLGATVRVISGARKLHRYSSGKSGYLSQGVFPLYFGLGDTADIDRIEVDWPSGVSQTVTEGLGPGRITIEEPRP